MKFVLLTLLLVTVFGPSNRATSQSLAKVREGTRGIIEAKYPKLEETLKNESEKETYYAWNVLRNGTTEGLTLWIFYGNSEKEAIDYMARISFRSPSTSGKKRTGFGDEAYSFKYPNLSRGRVRFRKANIYVDIFAPTLDEAEEIARGLDKLIYQRSR